MKNLFQIINGVTNKVIKPLNRGNVENYVYRPKVAPTSFAEGIAALRSHGWEVQEQPINNTSPSVIADIRVQAEQYGIPFIDYEINVEQFHRYCDQAAYQRCYPSYYEGNQPEKYLEHYLAFSLLHLSREDVFIDLASEHSPIPEIYARLSGATTYSQDIMYPPGMNGNRIGGDACALPLENGSVSKATLTCSLEHFEGDADTRLFKELARILKPGGIVCVAPFYIFNEAATQTDPSVCVPAGVVFDEGTKIYCAEKWGNRHGRFYSPASFSERIIEPVENQFKFDFYVLQNADAIDASIYIRFIFTATRL